MRHRELLLTAMLFLVTIFVITKMVPAHAEDSTDEKRRLPDPDRRDRLHRNAIPHHDRNGL